MLLDTELTWDEAPHSQLSLDGAIICQARSTGVGGHLHAHDTVVLVKYDRRAGFLFWTRRGRTKPN